MKTAKSPKLRKGTIRVHVGPATRETVEAMRAWTERLAVRLLASQKAA